MMASQYIMHDDVMTWKHFPHYRPLARETKGPVTQSLDSFFVVSLSEVSNKQPNYQWAETPQRQNNVNLMEGWPNSCHGETQTWYMGNMTRNL